MQHASLPQADTTGLVGAVELVAMLRRSWLWVAGAAGTGLLCAALWLHDATVPDWRAEARVTLAPDLATDRGNAAIAHATELERLRGTAMTREVAARLGFDRDPGYVDGGKPPLMVALDRWIGHPPTAPLADRAVERLQSRTSVQLVPGSAVARISASADDPAQAARIAQAFAERYVAQRTAALAQAEQRASAELAARDAEADQARQALAEPRGSDAPEGGLATIDRELRASRTRLHNAREAARRTAGGTGESARRRLDLGQMDRQQAELAATAGALAGELAAQDSLAAELARATRAIALGARPPLWLLAATAQDTQGVLAGRLKDLCAHLRPQCDDLTRRATGRVRLLRFERLAEDFALLQKDWGPARPAASPGKRLVCAAADGGAGRAGHAGRAGL